MQFSDSDTSNTSSGAPTPKPRFIKAALPQHLSGAARAPSSQLDSTQRAFTGATSLDMPHDRSDAEGRSDAVLQQSASPLRIDLTAGTYGSPMTTATRNAMKKGRGAEQEDAESSESADSDSAVPASQTAPPFFSKVAATATAAPAEKAAAAAVERQNVKSFRLVRSSSSSSSSGSSLSLDLHKTRPTGRAAAAQTQGNTSASVHQQLQLRREAGAGSTSSSSVPSTRSSSPASEVAAPRPRAPEPPSAASSSTSSSLSGVVFHKLAVPHAGAPAPVQKQPPTGSSSHPVGQHQQQARSTLHEPVPAAAALRPTPTPESAVASPHRDGGSTEEGKDNADIESHASSTLADVSHSPATPTDSSTAIQGTSTLNTTPPAADRIFRVSAQPASSTSIKNFKSTFSDFDDESEEEEKKPIRKGDGGEEEDFDSSAASVAAQAALDAAEQQQRVDSSSVVSPVTAPSLSITPSQSQPVLAPHFGVEVPAAPPLHPSALLSKNVEKRAEALDDAGTTIGPFTADSQQQHLPPPQQTPVDPHRSSDEVNAGPRRQPPPLPPPSTPPEMPKKPSTVAVPDTDAAVAGVHRGMTNTRVSVAHVHGGEGGSRTSSVTELTIEQQNAPATHGTFTHATSVENAQEAVVGYSTSLLPPTRSSSSTSASSRDNVGARRGSGKPSHGHTPRLTADTRPHKHMASHTMHQGGDDHSSNSSLLTPPHRTLDRSGTLEEDDGGHNAARSPVPTKRAGMAVASVGEGATTPLQQLKYQHSIQLPSTHLETHGETLTAIQPTTGGESSSRTSAVLMPPSPSQPRATLLSPHEASVDAASNSFEEMPRYAAAMEKAPVSSTLHGNPQPGGKAGLLPPQLADEASPLPPPPPPPVQQVASRMIPGSSSSSSNTSDAGGDTHAPADEANESRSDKDDGDGARSRNSSEPNRESAASAVAAVKAVPQTRFMSVLSSGSNTSSTGDEAGIKNKEEKTPAAAHADPFTGLQSSETRHMHAPFSSSSSSSSASAASFTPVQRQETNKPRLTLDDLFPTASAQSVAPAPPAAAAVAPVAPSSPDKTEENSSNGVVQSVESAHVDDAHAEAKHPPRDEWDVDDGVAALAASLDVAEDNLDDPTALQGAQRWDDVLRRMELIDCTVVSRVYQQTVRRARRNSGSYAATAEDEEDAEEEEGEVCLFKVLSFFPVVASDARARWRRRTDVQQRLLQLAEKMRNTQHALDMAGLTASGVERGSLVSRGDNSSSSNVDEARKSRTTCSGITEVYVDADCRLIAQLEAEPFMVPLRHLLPASCGSGLQESEVLALLRSVACKTATMHNAGFVHGALHPGNVLLSSYDGDTVLTQPCGLMSQSSSLPSDLSVISVRRAASMVGFVRHVWGDRALHIAGLGGSDGGGAGGRDGAMTSTRLGGVPSRPDMKELITCHSLAALGWTKEEEPRQEHVDRVADGTVTACTPTMADDVYALGMMAFFLYLGIPPFHSVSLWAAVERLMVLAEDYTAAPSREEARRVVTSFCFGSARQPSPSEAHATPDGTLTTSSPGLLTCPYSALQRHVAGRFHPDFEKSLQSFIVDCVEASCVEAMMETRSSTAEIDPSRAVVYHNAQDLLELHRLFADARPGAMGDAAAGEAAQAADEQMRDAVHRVAYPAFCTWTRAREACGSSPHISRLHSNALYAARCASLHECEPAAFLDDDAPPTVLSALCPEVSGTLRSWQPAFPSVTHPQGEEYDQERQPRKDSVSCEVSACHTPTEHAWQTAVSVRGSGRSALLTPSPVAAPTWLTKDDDDKGDGDSQQHLSEEKALAVQLLRAPSLTHPSTECDFSFYAHLHALVLADKRDACFALSRDFVRAYVSPVADTLVLQRLQDCTVTVLAPFRYVIVDDVRNCEVRLGPCEACFVRHVHACPLVAVAAHHLAGFDVADTHLSWSGQGSNNNNSNSDRDDYRALPQLETSHNVRFSLYGLAYSGLVEDYKRVGMPLEHVSSLRRPVAKDATDVHNSGLHHRHWELLATTANTRLQDEVGLCLTPEAPYAHAALAFGTRFVHRGSTTPVPTRQGTAQPQADVFHYYGEVHEKDVLICDVHGDKRSGEGEAGEAPTNRPMVFLHDVLGDVTVERCSWCTIAVVGTPSSLQMVDCHHCQLIFMAREAVLERCSHVECVALVTEYLLLRSCQDARVRPLFFDCPFADEVLRRVVMGSLGGPEEETVVAAYQAARLDLLNGVLRGVGQGVNVESSARVVVEDIAYYSAAPATERNEDAENSGGVVADRWLSVFTVPYAAVHSTPKEVGPAAHSDSSEIMAEAAQVLAEHLSVPVYTELLQRYDEEGSVAMAASSTDSGAVRTPNLVDFHDLLDCSILRLRAALCPIRSPEQAYAEAEGQLLPDGSNGSTADLVDVCVERVHFGALYIEDAVNTLHVRHCVGPLDIVVCAATTVVMEACAGVVLRTACVDFRAADCANCHVALHVNHAPQFQRCTSMQTSVLNITARAYEAVLALADVDPAVNAFSAPLLLTATWEETQTSTAPAASLDPHEIHTYCDGDAAAMPHGEAAASIVAGLKKELATCTRDAASSVVLARQTPLIMSLLRQPVTIVAPLPGLCVSPQETPFVESLEVHVARWRRQQATPATRFAIVEVALEALADVTSVYLDVPAWQRATGESKETKKEGEAHAEAEEPQEVPEETEAASKTAMFRSPSSVAEEEDPQDRVVDGKTQPESAKEEQLQFRAGRSHSSSQLASTISDAEKSRCEEKEASAAERAGVVEETDAIFEGSAQHEAAAANAEPSNIARDEAKEQQPSSPSHLHHAATDEHLSQPHSVRASASVGSLPPRTNHDAPTDDAVSSPSPQAPARRSEEEEDGGTVADMDFLIARKHQGTAATSSTVSETFEPTTVPLHHHHRDAAAHMEGVAASYAEPVSSRSPDAVPQDRSTPVRTPFSNDVSPDTSTSAGMPPAMRAGGGAMNTPSVTATVAAPLVHSSPSSSLGAPPMAPGPAYALTATDVGASATMDVFNRTHRSPYFAGTNGGIPEETGLSTQTRTTEEDGSMHLFEDSTSDQRPLPMRISPPVVAVLMEAFEGANAASGPLPSVLAAAVAAFEEDLSDDPLVKQSSRVEVPESSSRNSTSRSSSSHDSARASAHANEGIDVRANARVVTAAHFEEPLSSAQAFLGEEAAPPQHREGAGAFAAGGTAAVNFTRPTAITSSSSVSDYPRRGVHSHDDMESAPRGTSEELSPARLPGACQVPTNYLHFSEESPARTDNAAEGPQLPCDGVRNSQGSPRTSSAVYSSLPLEAVPAVAADARLQELMRQVDEARARFARQQQQEFASAAPLEARVKDALGKIYAMRRLEGRA